MNRASKNICSVLQAAVRKHAKGNDKTDSEIEALMEKGVPATIAAVIESCKAGSWTAPEIKSRSAALAARRAERLAAEGGSQPKATPKK